MVEETILVASVTFQGVKTDRRGTEEEFTETRHFSIPKLFPPAYPRFLGLKCIVTSGWEEDILETESSMEALSTHTIKKSTPCSAFTEVMHAIVSEALFQLSITTATLDTRCHLFGINIT